MPQVSVIIPTYDRPRYLRRALNSVLRQTFKDYEIIVVQNGPAQYAKALVQRVARRNVVIRYLHVRKADPANARNVGVRAAKGEYIAFLDDDDEWLPGKLQAQVDILRRKKDVGLVACSVVMVNDKRPGMGNSYEYPEGKLALRTLLRKGSVIHTLSSVLVRKLCIDEAGGFNAKFPICNDYDLYLRLTQVTKLWLTPKPLVYWHRHGRNLSDDMVQGYGEMVDLLRKLKLAKSKFSTGSIRLIKDALDVWRFLLKHTDLVTQNKRPTSVYGSPIGLKREIRRLKLALEVHREDSIVVRHWLAVAYHRAGSHKEARAQARAGFNLINFNRYDKILKV